MASPEDIPDAVAVDLTSTELHPAEEDLPLGRMREDQFLEGRLVAVMPPPVQDADQLALLDVLRDVQDVLER